MDKSIKHTITKSFAEQKNEADNKPLLGIVCPSCGCNITMITHTIRLYGWVRRYRKCANPKCRFNFKSEDRLVRPDVKKKE